MRIPWTTTISKNMTGSTIMKIRRKRLLNCPLESKAKGSSMAGNITGNTNALINMERPKYKININMVTLSMFARKIFQP